MSRAGETYAEILERTDGLDELTADGDSGPSRADTGVIVGSLVASRLGRFGRTLVGASHATVPRRRLRRPLRRGQGRPRTRCAADEHGSCR